MSKSLPIELGHVQKTLLLPLWGRAQEMQKQQPILADPAAAAIIAELDYDFSTIAANMSPITQLAWIARCIHIDRTVRGYLDRYPQASVVNLGCGLDTTFERVDNGTLQWYDLDLPDVIRLRRELIAEGPRRKFIAASLLDSGWHSAIRPADRVIFIAAGVLYYFEADQVRDVLRSLAQSFPGAEIVFDACSAFGMRTANQRVIRDGGMDENATLKWGLENPRSIGDWSEGIEVLDAYPLFRGLKSGLGLRARWGTFMSDVLKVMSMVHLRIRKAQDRPT